MNSLINKILGLWFKLGEKLRFLLMGGYNTVFAYTLFCVLEYSLDQHINYLLVLVLAHFISTINSFFTFRFFVFRSQKNIWHEFVKTNITYLGYLACNSLLLFTLKSVFGINLFLSQFICIIILTVAVYFSHKHFSFRQ